MEKIEKLELKHLCGYLPHGLEMIFEKSGRIIELDGIQLTDGGNLIYSCYDNYMESTIWNFKPLLLPLSALTEQMEDGSVPIVEAAKIAYEWQKWDEKRINKNNGVLEGSPYDFWFSEEKMEFMLCDGGGYLHINNQLQLFEYLYSKHFDIYGLIPAGLAIDKRTVKL